MRVLHSPSELRELARRIEARHVALHTEHALDAWEDAIRECEHRPRDAERNAPDWPDTESEHDHRLIVDVLRQAADDAEAMLRFIHG